MEGSEAIGDNNVPYMKVMTDEQMEVLRKQISIYATICEQLVEMHKAVTAQQDSLAGKFSSTSLFISRKGILIRFLPPST
jgi:hypothetical protein